MSYERYEAQRRRQTFVTPSRRTTFGYWVPLVLTVTVATVGLAAWVWKERSDDDDEDYHRDHSKPPEGQSEGRRSRSADLQPGLADQGIVNRMSDALGRTSSPQQILDEAGRRVVAGVAAASAAVGDALGSIRGDNRGDYEDHSRWSEEAATRTGGAEKALSVSSGILSSRPFPSGKKGEAARKVAIVVSAQTDQPNLNSEEATYLQEHASILSHLPEHIDADAKVFVMIYDPSLLKHPLSSATYSRAVGSVESSYENINAEELNTPGEEIDKTSGIDIQTNLSSASSMFKALYRQAQSLVDKEAMIMPFTTPSGYVTLLKHVNPSVVYVQATLAGNEGESVKEIARWAGQVVLVVGDETGHGGLVDSEDERTPSRDPKRHWWRDDSSVGRGKGIEVVEGLRVGEDWNRRVKGHD